MENDNICPSAENCPIFKGILQHKDFTTKSYKMIYCESGLDGRKKCIRWQCKEKFGKVPDDLLPNSSKTLEEIGNENEWFI